MISVEMQGDQAVVLDFKNAPSQVTRALVRSLNRGIASAKTQMVQDIARDTGLKSAVVRDALPVREATAATPSARLAAGLKRIPLMDFNAKASRSGVTAKLPGGAGRYPHAFIATMKSGHVGVFQRVSKRRLAIRELFGPSLGHVFGKYRASALARGLESFETNFKHELSFSSAQGASDAG